jgi:hypothetical protein
MVTARLSAVLVTVAALLSLAGAAQGAQPAPLWMGYVFDPGRPAVYMMGAKGGLEAIHPRTGRVLWKST